MRKDIIVAVIMLEEGRARRSRFANHKFNSIPENFREAMKVELAKSREESKVEVKEAARAEAAIGERTGTLTSYVYRRCY